MHIAILIWVCLMKKHVFSLRFRLFDDDTEGEQTRRLICNRLKNATRNFVKKSHESEQPH